MCGGTTAQTKRQTGEQWGFGRKKSGRTSKKKGLDEPPICEELPTLRWPEVCETLVKAAEVTIGRRKRFDGTLFLEEDRDELEQQQKLCDEALG